MCLDPYQIINKGFAEVTVNVTYGQHVKIHLTPHTLCYLYFIRKYYKTFEL